MHTVTELEQMLRDLKETERLEGEQAWREAQKNTTHEWVVIWHDKYSVSVRKKPDAASTKKYAELDLAYPHSYSRVRVEDRDFKGMRYTVVGNVIVQTGGGYCVLKVGSFSSQKDWYEMSAREESLLRKGEVADSLKR